VSKLFSADVCRDVKGESDYSSPDLPGVQNSVVVQLEGIVPLRSSTDAHQAGTDTVRLADTLCPWCGRAPNTQAVVRVPIEIVCAVCCGSYELVLPQLSNRPAHAIQINQMED
jgi:hypothetical protein